MKQSPPQYFLKQCFDYNPSSGYLEWRNRPTDHFESEAYCRRWNTKNAGKPVGTSKGRYPQVNFTGEKFYVHRLVWKLKTGQEPKVIDHIDGDVRNNRWSNLRSVSAQESSRNLPTTSKSTSGVVGIHHLKSNGRWLAHIKISGKVIRLGEFLDKQDAIAARKAAEKQYGFHPNHGRARV